MRDLIRARYQVSRQQHRARQQLKMFLLRHKIRYAGTTSWTPKHLDFLARVNIRDQDTLFCYDIKAK